jgi:uncharacterized protein (TIGR04222 family)
MNPFALHGFAFLFFYLLVGAATLFVLRTVIRAMETAGERDVPTMTDPYLIACLRAGKNEAMRVATVALLDRGLLFPIGEEVKAKGANSAQLVQRPLEKAILTRFRSAAGAHELFKDPAAGQACAGYLKVLRSYGLVADARVFAARALPVLVALAVLVGVGGAKINIALSEGRHNIGFLIALMLAFSVLALYFWFKRLTARGADSVDDLKQLFSRLKQRKARLRKGGETNEVAMLAAVFGLSALSASDFPFLEKLYPAKSSDGSSCGSSSSCSSGSSCSGGCGGGGCGG